MRLQTFASGPRGGLQSPACDVLRRSESAVSFAVVLLGRGSPVIVLAAITVVTDTPLDTNPAPGSKATMQRLLRRRTELIDHVR